MFAEKYLHICREENYLELFRVLLERGDSGAGNWVGYFFVCPLPSNLLSILLHLTWFLEADLYGLPQHLAMLICFLLCSAKGRSGRSLKDLKEEGKVRLAMGHVPDSFSVRLQLRASLCSRSQLLLGGPVNVFSFGYFLRAPVMALFLPTIRVTRGSHSLLLLGFGYFTIPWW
jgi:hypothetical protein